MMDKSTLDFTFFFYTKIVKFWVLINFWFKEMNKPAQNFLISNCVLNVHSDILIQPIVKTANKTVKQKCIQ